MKSLNIRPIHSIIFREDAENSKDSPTIGKAAITATNACISSGTYPEPDGETHVLVSLIREVSPGTPPNFEGLLETANHTLVVQTSELVKLAEAHVSNDRTLVNI